MNEKTVNKNKFFNATFFITNIVCLLPIALGYILWNKLPEDIPMQYGWDNQVNWTLPKAIAIYTCPVLLCVINTIVQFVIWKFSGLNAGGAESSADTVAAGQENSSIKKRNDKVTLVAVWIIPLMALVINSFILLKPAGLNLSPDVVIIFISSLVLIIPGNYLPKLKPNPVIGIRAPWINSNPDVWYKTNRLGGILFVITGLINLPLCFTPIGKIVFASSCGCVVVVLLVYSLVLAKKYGSIKKSA